MFINKYSAFNYWANNLLTTAIEKHLDDQKLDQEIISSYPSLRKTVYHIWDAEFLWLNRLKGKSLFEWPSKNFEGTFSEAKTDMLKNNQLFIDFVESLDNSQILTYFEYKNIEGKKFSSAIWEAVMHCINHSSYHRGQVVTMMRQLGMTKIPATDFIAYCRL
jgi:uncharacterized damage-inducible protein DinB